MSEPSEGGALVPDDKPTTPLPPVGPAVGADAEEAVFAALAGPTGLAGDDAWPGRARRSGVRVRVPMLLLLTLVVAAGAFWGGAAVQRSDGTSSSGAAASAAVSRIAALFARRGSAGSGSGSATGGFTAPAASGTLTAVVGRTLYLTTSSGTIVKVTVPATAAVDLNAKASAETLKSGDNVVVRGTTSKAGIVTATSVSASAPGVSSVARGGFGGIGGGAGGFGGTSAGGSGG